MKHLALCLTPLVGLLVGFLLASGMWESSPLKLGISLEEVQRQLGERIVLTSSSIDYPPRRPTAEEREKDVVNYTEHEVSPGLKFNLGFKAANILVEVQRVRTWTLHGKTK